MGFRPTTLVEKIIFWAICSFTVIMCVIGVTYVLLRAPTHFKVTGTGEMSEIKNAVDQQKSQQQNLNTTTKP